MTAGVLVLGGGIAGALVLLQSGSDKPGLSASGNSITANGPWRLRIDPRDANGIGCRITLTDTRSGSTVPLRQPANGIYSQIQLQVHESGSFTWQANDPGCLVSPIAGSGVGVLPFLWGSGWDSDAFAAPAQVTVNAKDFHGNSSCDLQLLDPSTGQQLDRVTARPGADTVKLDPRGIKTVYLYPDYCEVFVSR